MSKYTELLNSKRTDLSKIYPILGQGSSRVVFDIGDAVLKLAKSNQKGTAQNSGEYDIYRYGDNCVDILCPIYDVSDDDSIIIMAKTIPLKNLNTLPTNIQKEIKCFKQLLKDMRDYYCSGLCSCSKIKHTRRVICLTEKRISEINNSDLFNDICVLINDFDLVFGDSFHPSSWGYMDGKFVLIDYGLTESDYRNLYSRRAC